METAVILLHSQLHLVAKSLDFPIIQHISQFPLPWALLQPRLSLWGLSPAAMMLHSENMFPLLEPCGCGAWDDDSSSFSLCPSAIRVAPRAGYRWHFYARWKRAFYWVCCDPLIPGALMTCSNSAQHLWQPEPARVRALIQNCYTSNTLFHTKTASFITLKNH